MTIQIEAGQGHIKAADDLESSMLAAIDNAQIGDSTKHQSKTGWMAEIAVLKAEILN